MESLQAENVDLKKNLGLATSRQNTIRDNLITEKFETFLSSQGKNWLFTQVVSYQILPEQKHSSLKFWKKRKP